MSVQFLQTPIGVLTLQEKDDRLTRVVFLFGRRHTPKEQFPAWLLGREKDELTSFKIKELSQIAEVCNHDEFRSTILLDQAKRQLLEYFDKKRQVFDLPLNPEGTTFRRRVWQGLATIPYGQTETYGALAQLIGSPKASRAVGAAMRDNPIAIILPCHRIVGTHGKLTGYNGGLDRKTFLLQLESNN